MISRPKPLVIAIDGPSGSGKSSVSRTVALRLNLAYLDTGAMYRALTWWCTQQGIDLEDLDAVAQAAKDLPLHMETDPRSPSVQVAGVVIDEAIRTTEISASVSKVATNLAVRNELCHRQQALIAESAANSGGVVAEGRDITTVVAPGADVRILLVANQDARLARRAKELHGEAGHAAMSATHDQIVRRDKDDSTVSEFMDAAPGVTSLDTTDLSFEQSVEAVLELVATHTGRDELAITLADRDRPKVRDNG
ncbi:MAG TPA: (d)CMP kinase [Dermatophilaceae bacterium]|nr:(d)CMP kinase [Dermatophilaceae bacterium]